MKANQSKTVVFLSTFLTLSCLVSQFAYATVAPHSALRGATRGVETFNISGEPEKVDWKYFLEASEPFRKSLWDYHYQQKKSLKDWSWQWRLGWLRACTSSTESYCAKIFEAALGDKAVVVRADAATRLGVRFESSGNQWAIKSLVQAYENPKNIRNGNPLYIQQRILFSLKQIGGAKATNEAGRIARSHRGSSSYWQKLNRG